MLTRRFLLHVFFLKVYIFVFLSTSIFSQEYSYRHYTVKDGLVQNQVMTMFRDSKGYLWLGTKGGVSRFDGMKFENYTVNDGLISNQIIRIFEDSEGGINFCSIIGVSRFYKDEIKPMILNDTIQSDNRLFIIPRYTKTDFCILNQSKIPIYNAPFDSIQIKTLLRFQDINPGLIIKEHNKYRYWTRGNDGMIYCINSDTVVCLENAIKANVIKDKRGRLFAFYNNSLFEIDTTLNKLNLVYHYAGKEIAILYDFDKQNKAYFGCGQKKIIVYDGAGIEVYTKNFNYINAILVDKEDNLWIATETGFYKKINNAFENFTTETGTNEYVWSIVEDWEHNIWFASYGDGLSKWDRKEVKVITDYQRVYNSFQGNYFYTGATLASNHKIYFPVKEKGVLQFDGRNFSLIPGLPIGSVLDVFDDASNNRLLVASTAGLVLLEDYSKPILLEKDFLESRKFIKTIAQDKFSRYWLGGEYMLNIFDGKDFIEFPNEEFDYNAGAISIFMDHRKNLWLGTTSGLYFFNYKEFKKIGRDVLKSQVVSFVELDTLKLVMGVSEGLAILNLDPFYQSSEEQIEILDESVGFLGFDCIRNGILKDSGNNIWVAASDRVVKFYPNRFKRDTISPLIFIQSVRAISSKMEEMLTFYSDFDSEAAIELSHLYKDFRIDFHAVHYNAAEKINYSYMLTGNDKSWSTPSKERFVSYTNLSPGKYTFNVIAQNIDGVWSKNPAVVAFNIVPAFWQTFTFRIFVNVIILFMALSVIYLIWNYRKKRKEKIMETERQISELQLKTIRSQMDPHFTFNALNSISSVIYKENKEKAYRYFTKFSKLVRSSLEASDKISRTIEEEIEFTKNYLDLEKIRFGDQFEYSIKINTGVRMDTMVPKMIIHNYAENAVKHGLKHKENNRRLTIDVSVEDSSLVILVEDNGVGRQQAEALNEFSTGKGLKIMNNIYDLYFKLYKVRIRHEIVDLVDKEGKGNGTRIILKVPVDY